MTVGDRLESIGIFCGSAKGCSDAYIKAATATGTILAEARLAVVYGGGSVGLMGAVANAGLKAGGKVVGVMPRSLVDREIAHKGLSDLIVVNNMHERKAKMARLSDAFLVLPGGSGTLEEFFEQWTWAQLGYHQKPIGLINIEGFFDPLLTMIDHMTKTGFLGHAYRDMLIAHDNVQAVLHDFQRYTHPAQKTY